MDRKSQVVLITGCSSGIGKSIAVELATRGQIVHATARNADSIIRMKGIHPLQLDVTKIETIKAAVSEVMRISGRIDMLINNAGFGLMGPVLELSLDAFRRQMETNVTGLLAVTQEVAPHMIRQGSGRIINVGSVSGILTSPFAGAYCASKAAVHSLSDAMRLEMEPLGIKVITLQPGGVISRFGDTATEGISLCKDSFYAPIKSAIEERARIGQVGSMDADEFARIVTNDLLADNPPAIIRHAINSIKLPAIRWLLPVSTQDKILRKKFKLNGLKKTTGS